MKEFKPFPSPFKTLDGIEFAPIVRCRDCKWKPRNMGCRVDVENLDFPLDRDSCVICPYGSDDPWYNREPDPNGFCSRGERKEG